jgi:curved DNA-binding protein CbpA
MKTLYDLLGARADEDAEGLRDAFRKAAKANHPDLHAGDPDAPIRFRQIVEAYDILRDAEQRAVYDRLLKFARERLRRRLKSTASYLVRSIVSDAVAVVGLAIVLGGGYTLFAYVSKTPIETAKLAEVTAREPTRHATGLSAWWRPRRRSC